MNGVHHGTNRETALGREGTIGRIGNVSTCSATSRNRLGPGVGPVSKKATLAPKTFKTTYTLATKWATKNKQARLRTLVDTMSPLVYLTP
jgi:hypothetical protein